MSNGVYVAVTCAGVIVKVVVDGGNVVRIVSAGSVSAGKVTAACVVVSIKVKSSTVVRVSAGREGKDTLSSVVVKIAVVVSVAVWITKDG